MNVITSGYNAENGRQSCGLDPHHHQVGHQPVPRVGLDNIRRDEWNKNDFFREQSGDAKPFFEVNIGGYSIGGPVIIPKVVDSRTSEKKFYFFVSQEFTDDVRPTAVTRTNLPTELERGGDFSQTRITNGTIQPIIDPVTGLQFPGNVIPTANSSPGCDVQFAASTRSARRCSTCCRCRTTCSTSSVHTTRTTRRT